MATYATSPSDRNTLAEKEFRIAFIKSIIRKWLLDLLDEEEKVFDKYKQLRFNGQIDNDLEDKDIYKICVANNHDKDDLHASPIAHFADVTGLSTDYSSGYEPKHEDMKKAVLDYSRKVHEVIGNINGLITISHMVVGSNEYGYIFGFKTVEEPVINSNSCNQEVYTKGTLIGIFDMTAEQADALCKERTYKTGFVHDWSSYAGRKMVKALVI